MWIWQQGSDEGGCAGGTQSQCQVREGQGGEYLRSLGYGGICLNYLVKLSVFP